MLVVCGLLFFDIVSCGENPPHERDSLRDATITV
jgi:hypothetical protein